MSNLEANELIAAGYHIVRVEVPMRACFVLSLYKVMRGSFSQPYVIAAQDIGKKVVELLTSANSPGDAGVVSEPLSTRVMQDINQAAQSFSTPAGIDIDHRLMASQAVALLKVLDPDVISWRDMLKAVDKCLPEDKPMVNQVYGAVCATIGETALHHIFEHDANLSNMVDALLDWNAGQGRI